MAEDRRRDKWARFAPYNEHLHLLIPEIADDLDDLHHLVERVDARLAKLVGISASLLISVCVGLVLALIGRI